MRRLVIVQRDRHTSLSSSSSSNLPRRATTGGEDGEESESSSSVWRLAWSSRKAAGYDAPHFPGAMAVVSVLSCYNFASGYGDAVGRSERLRKQIFWFNEGCGGVRAEKKKFKCRGLKLRDTHRDKTSADRCMFGLHNPWHKLRAPTCTTHHGRISTPVARATTHNARPHPPNTGSSPEPPHHFPRILQRSFEARLPARQLAQPGPRKRPLPPEDGPQHIGDQCDALVLGRRYGQGPARER